MKKSALFFFQIIWIHWIHQRVKLKVLIKILAFFDQLYILRAYFILSHSECCPHAVLLSLISLEFSH